MFQMYLGRLTTAVQTGACAVVNVLKPNTDDSIGVFGLGGVGLSAVMVSYHDFASA